jgi:hypothetical protein
MPMNCARSSIGLLALCASACGTVVAPDAMLGDGGFVDAAMNDSNETLDVSHSVRTAVRPDSVLYLTRARTMDGRDRTSVALWPGRRDENVGPQWEEVREANCTTSTVRYPRGREEEVARFDTEIDWSGERLATCSWGNCDALAFATPSRLDVPLGVRFRIGDFFSASAACLLPPIGVLVELPPAEPQPTWRPTEPLRFRWSPTEAVRTVAVWLEDNGASGVRRYVRCEADGRAGELVVPRSMLSGYDPSRSIYGIIGARNEYVLTVNGWTLRAELWTEPQGVGFVGRL